MHTVSGRGSARIECTVRDREVGGSNPPAPTKSLFLYKRLFYLKLQNGLILNFFCQFHKFVNIREVRN